MKTSGRNSFNVCRRAGGMPYLRQSDTDAGEIFGSNKRATAEVPPRSSIILESFMGRILGIPEIHCQGKPKQINDRLAYMKTWHERLKTARKTAGCTQTELARVVGVSNATVSDWESGVVHNLEAQNLLNICDFFNISPTWLQFGRGDMNQVALSADDLHALQINRALGTRERKAWYRAGDSLAEPSEGTNGDS